MLFINYIGIKIELFNILLIIVIIFSQKGIMCGIWLLIKKNPDYKSQDDNICKDNIKPRGPDKSIYGENDKYGFEYVFHRLAIEDLSSCGDQPFIHNDQNRLIYVFCNGEIYNHKQIAKSRNYTNFISDSDLLDFNFGASDSCPLQGPQHDDVKWCDSRFGESAPATRRFCR